MDYLKLCEVIGIELKDITKEIKCKFVDVSDKFYELQLRYKDNLITSVSLDPKAKVFSSYDLVEDNSDSDVAYFICRHEEEGMMFNIKMASKEDIMQKLKYLIEKLEYDL